MNSSALLRPGRRVATDIAQVRDDLVVRSTVRVAKDRRVAADGRQPLALDGEGDGQLGGLARRRRIGGERQSRPLVDLDEQVRPTLERGGEPDAEVGEALADEALGRIDEQDRGLEAALRVDQVGLLPGMLEVVARVGLVGDQCRSGRRPGPAGRC